MTGTEIITEAQSLTRQGQGVATATFLLWLNRINRKYARLQDWPILLTQAVFTSGSSLGNFDLPATFDRMAGDFVNYDATATTNGYLNGIMVPILHSGDPMLDGIITAWGDTGTAYAPSVAYVAQKSGATNMQLRLAPFPEVYGKTIVYRYYRTPSAVVAGTDIELASLSGTYTMALCKEIMLYLGDTQTKQAEYFLGEERREYQSAMRTLFQL